MNPQWLGILAALAAVLFVLYLLRRGILPERFAALWILVSSALLVLAVFPQILTWVADVTGVQIPLNLLLFAAAVLLLLVSVQLSFEVGRLEARTRRLAEEVALLADRIDRLPTSERDGEPLRGGGADGASGHARQTGRGIPSDG